MNTDTFPLVTIALTCFNANNTIARAIDSALGQTYPNTEILIVDDASSDGSVKIIKEYVSKHDQLRLILHNDNKGAPTAFNTLVQHANGKYICFFDDDDVSSPERVELTTHALEECQDLVVCFCDRYITGKEGIFTGVRPPVVSARRFKEYMLEALYLHLSSVGDVENGLCESLQQHGVMGAAGSGIMTAPTSLFKKHLFDVKMLRFSDTEWNLRVAYNDVGAINVAMPLMTQYLSEGVDKSEAIQKSALMYAMDKHNKLYDDYFEIDYQNKIGSTMNLYDCLGEAIPNDHTRQVSSIELVSSYVDKGFLPAKILDFGCGVGNTHSIFNSVLPESHWIGVDIDSSPEVDARVESEAHILSYDGYILPFSNNYFDLVYSNQVLEHVRKPELALQEVARVLTTEGLFIGQTSQFEPYHSFSYWNFTLYGFKKMVEDAGMELIEYRPGIDGFTLMQRSYTWDLDKYNKFFSEESPINHEIQVEGETNNSSNRVINYKKLMYTGQFCFVCRLHKNN